MNGKGQDGDDDCSSSSCNGVEIDESLSMEAPVTAALHMGYGVQARP